jgi:predicted 3-demethylubiquinone-9 3-methyltransferase (glyoxalase superfamily)
MNRRRKGREQLPRRDRVKATSCTAPARRLVSRCNGSLHFFGLNDQAEEAARFHVSVFKNSKTNEVTYYTGEEPTGTKGSILTVAFELDGQEFVALNDGPKFKFTEAVSFVVNCDTQEEIDNYWEKLTADGGEEAMQRAYDGE